MTLFMDNASFGPFSLFRPSASTGVVLSLQGLRSTGYHVLKIQMTDPQRNSSDVSLDVIRSVFSRTLLPNLIICIHFRITGLPSTISQSSTSSVALDSATTTSSDPTTSSSTTNNDISTALNTTSSSQSVLPAPPPTSDPAPQSNQQSQASRTGLIFGGIFAGLIFIGICTFLVFHFRRRRRRREEEQAQEQATSDRFPASLSDKDVWETSPHDPNRRHIWPSASLRGLRESTITSSGVPFASLEPPLSSATSSNSPYPLAFSPTSRQRRFSDEPLDGPWILNHPYTSPGLPPGPRKVKSHDGLSSYGPRLGQRPSKEDYSGMK